MGPAAVVLGLASMAAAGTGTPAPDPTPYTLSYRAAQGCPPEDLLRADVAAHVRSALRPSGVRIEISIVAAPPGTTSAWRDRGTECSLSDHDRSGRRHGHGDRVFGVHQRWRQGRHDVARLAPDLPRSHRRRFAGDHDQSRDAVAGILPDHPAAVSERDRAAGSGALR